MTCTCIYVITAHWTNTVVTPILQSASIVAWSVPALTDTPLYPQSAPNTLSSHLSDLLVDRYKRTRPMAVTQASPWGWPERGPEWRGNSLANWSHTLGSHQWRQVNYLCVCWCQWDVFACVCGCVCVQVCGCEGLLTLEPLTVNEVHSADCVRERSAAGRERQTVVVMLNLWG